MVAQFIVGIGMREDVERAMIARKPTYDIGKLLVPRSQVVADIRIEQCLRHRR